MFYLFLFCLTCFGFVYSMIMPDNFFFFGVKIYQAIICIYANVTSLFQYPGHQSEKDKKPEIPALVRVKLWLGLVNEEKEWHKMQTEGELAVYAETVSYKPIYTYCQANFTLPLIIDVCTIKN